MSSSSVNTKFELVILNKVDSEGNYSLLHPKPLNIEIFNQIPDSLLVFYSGNYIFLIIIFNRFNF
jgi:hypothetical protein